MATSPVSAVTATAPATPDRQPPAPSPPVERTAGRLARTLSLPRSISGWGSAWLMFAASMAPSLLPRSWAVQGAISGVALSLGYGLGLIVQASVRRVARRGLPGAALVFGRIASLSLGLGAALWSVAVNQAWQTDVRALMGLEPAGWHYPLAVTAAALPTAAILLALARLIRVGHGTYVRAVSRLLPIRWRRPVRAAVALLLAALTLDVALGDWSVGALRDASAAADARYEVEVRRPVSTARSGGPGSAIAWGELGRMGREFVGTGPDAEQLESFSGAPAKPPIRVYIGLGAAKSARDRAALAVAELERTGAFERKVLLVVTPTGTGWVDHDAVDPLEYLYNGDTAAVAIQYSYLPSWAAMIGNQDRAEQAATALFDAVTDRLDELPADSRPRVLLYGQSLGAFGSQRVFHSVDDLAGRVDGALWAGPPRASPLWRDVVADRDPGSPVWQPVYGGGATVRFGSDGAALGRPGTVWKAPRIAFLQNATDPITWWSPQLLASRPEWMDEPRGPGVSARMPFVPVVTGLQIGLDLLQSMDAPAGHGHVFDAAHAEAWVMIAPPQGWSPQDTDRLLSVVAAQSEAG